MSQPSAEAPLIGSDDRPEVTLPGYELVEKVGVGGYGEVWSAVAPGGLRKAVKYVFGSEFDKRATSELHSLEKIKTVRHPFLLSLERIEVVAGRLLVVSELADGSLRDRFRQCVAEGLPGVPREELLGYLSDAADALDFLSTRHDLAHLDVKPENLLLVAGHVKVADFGLVKSLSSAPQASLVGGMTPTYAAPEVFRGAPGRWSDQYSLAVVFQEILTGTLPFDGGNAAELTLQHMKDDPNLGALSDGDRFAVARALAKDPTHRFDSSRAFVHALREGTSTGVVSWDRAGVSASPRFVAPAAAMASRASTFSVTEVFEDAVADPTSAEGDPATLRLRPEPLVAPTPLEAVPPQPNGSPFEAAPVAFIGVGGTAARVLRSLRVQMHEHLGATAPLPSAPILLLDTDPQSLASAARGGDRGRGLDPSETVALPLRRPQAYRDKADVLLRWLGRRWLYNVPRSLRTEGIRPLGRLALVDHARQAFQRLRATLAAAVDPASRQASTDAVGLPFTAPALRVYVVASTSGGAGSGMAIDLAYAARSIATRLGVGKYTLIGVMTHSTSRDASRCELARVNAYAWLSEFQRFRSSPQGYPGDAGVGLPGHEPGVAAFDHTYFVPLGEHIETPAFESAAEAIAEYLFADAFTPGQRLLDACRSSDAGSAEMTVRSFAVRHRDGQSDLTLDPLERSAVARMVDRWLGDGARQTGGEVELNSTDQVVHGAVAFLGRTQLDSATLASNCRSLLEASLGGDASAFFAARFGADRDRPLGDLASAVDRCIGVGVEDSSPQRIDGRPIDDIVAPITNRLADEAAFWTLGRVNDTQERVAGAASAVAWLRDHLSATDRELHKMTPHVESERSRLVARPAAALETAGDDSRFKQFRLRLDHAALVAARRVVAALHGRLNDLDAEIEGLRSVVATLSATLAGGGPVADDDAAATDRFSIAVEQRLQTDYLSVNGGLLGALTRAGAAETLAATIAHAAKAVSRELGLTSRAAADAALAAGFADPPIQDCGGVYRRLTLEQPSTGDEDAGDAPPSELLLVTEMAGVSLPHLAASLIGGRRDYAAFAERVRARRDVPWVDPVSGVERSIERPTGPPLTLSCPPIATAVIG